MAYSEILRNSLITRRSPYGGGGTDMERDPITGEMLPGVPDDIGTGGVPLDPGLDLRPPGPTGDEWDDDGGSTIPRPGRPPPDPGGPNLPSGPTTPGPMSNRLTRAMKMRSFYEPSWFGGKSPYDSPLDLLRSGAAPRDIAPDADSYGRLLFQGSGQGSGGTMAPAPVTMGGFAFDQPEADLSLPQFGSPTSYRDALKNVNLRRAYEGTDTRYGVGQLSGYGIGALQDYGVGALNRRR